MSAAASTQWKDVLEAEVPNEILEQFCVLQNTLKANDKMAQDFMLNNSADELQKLDADVERLMRLLGEGRDELRRERFKNHELAERVARDSQMSELVQRRKEMLQKNPQYGRAQAIDYLHAIANEHERTLLDHESNVTRIEQTLRQLADTNVEFSGTTERDLAEHIQRFDEIFTVVAAQQCAVSEDVERLKETYMERQRKLYGRYATNPFEKRKERQKQHDAVSNLRGLDAFPSQHAVLSMSEFLPRQPAAVQPVGGVGGFGATPSTGIFGGATKPASTGFSLFGQPQQPIATAKPLFGGTATSLSSSMAANKPLFGAAAATSAATTGNIFGGFGAVAVPASSANTLMFNAKPTTSGAAAPATGGGLFGTPVSAAGAAPAFGSTLSSTTGGGLFGTPVSAAGAAPAFGSTLSSTTGGGLFGTPVSATGAAPAFGSTLSSTTGGSLFGTPAFGSTLSSTTGGGLFGTPASAAAAAPAFSSTLSSTTSGTLFRGSADAGGPPTKSLFGNK